MGAFFIAGSVVAAAISPIFPEAIRASCRNIKLSIKISPIPLAPDFSAISRQGRVSVCYVGAALSGKKSLPPVAIFYFVIENF